MDDFDDKYEYFKTMCYGYTINWKIFLNVNSVNSCVSRNISKFSLQYISVYLYSENIKSTKMIGNLKQ